MNLRPLSIDALSRARAMLLISRGQTQIFALALFAACIGIFVQPSTSRATTITSTVHGFVADFGTQDGTGDGVNPITVEVANFGTSSSQVRGIIEFDISGISNSVSSAALVLPIAYNFLTTLQQFDVYGYTGDGLLTYSDYALSASLVGSFSADHSTTGPINFDVTDFINEQINLNNQFAGLEIVWGGSAMSSSWIDFGASGAGSDINPQLEFELNATPIPAALPLFISGLGMVGLLGWRRKRKAKLAT